MHDDNNQHINITVNRLGEILQRVGVSPPDIEPDRATPIRDLDSMATLDMLLSAERIFDVQLDAQVLIETGAFDRLSSLADFIEGQQRKSDARK